MDRLEEYIKKTGIHWISTNHLRRFGMNRKDPKSGQNTDKTWLSVAACVIVTRCISLFFIS
ncbi:MAG: hypothetical protein IPN68_15915 [Bacteroidetes bacterium]|nr:hypothetical protein [Bacteroidota bacterium]